MRNTTILITSAVLAGCGGGGLSPGVGDDPGTGTGTLLVDGDVSAVPAIDNAQDAADFTTEVSIRIGKAGVPVTTGEVTIDSFAGTFPLVFDPSQDGGRWRTTLTGYAQVYELNVTAGDDTVEGVRVDGPDVHWFDAPVAGATVDASLPLAVEWSRDRQAAGATIQTRERDAVGIVDSGDYMLAAGMLRSKATETEQETLELRRDARVAPAGAVGGSELRVRITNRIDVVVAPCPTCQN